MPTREDVFGAIEPRVLTAVRVHILHNPLADAKGVPECGIGERTEFSAEISSFDKAQIVLARDWRHLMSVPSAELEAKSVACMISEDIASAMSIPAFRHARRFVDLWLAESERARQKLEAAGMAVVCVPPMVDGGVFRPLGAEEFGLRQIRAKLDLKEDGEKVVGGLFPDEAAAGTDGLEVFAAIVKRLATRGLRLCVLLGESASQQLAEDLTRFNVRPAIWDTTTVGVGGAGAEAGLRNFYYNLLDLCLVTDRRDLGMRRLAEAVCAGSPAMISRETVPTELLDYLMVFDDIVDAVDGAEAHLKRRHTKITEAELFSILQMYAPETISGSFANALSAIRPIRKRHVKRTPRRTSRWQDLAQRWSRSLSGQGPKITIWNRFQQSPWGGANQFLQALNKSMQRQGARVTVNGGGVGVKAALMNAHTFEESRFRKWIKRRRVPCVHRVDGLYMMHHGGNKDRDDQVLALNDEFAHVTVTQSFWSYIQFVRDNRSLSQPVIITNAVDPEIFHPVGRIAFSRNRKTRLITTSWSDNIRKGGAIYRWLDENLDWSRFQYTYVGNTSEAFRNIRHMAPVGSAELAGILRENDIFVTASINDSCSNAVIEALACGLPVLYIKDGGHPELVGVGGLPFLSERDILPALDRLVHSYELFQEVIRVPSLDEVAQRYMQIFKELCSSSYQRS